MTIIDSKAWFPYDRNDRSTTIAEVEKFLSLRSLRFRVATIAKIAECMFPYARKDRSDRCDRCDRCDHMETRLYTLGKAILKFGIGISTREKCPLKRVC